MYSKENQDVYILHKFLLAIMFNGKKGILDKPWVYDISILKSMKGLIKSSVECGLLSSDVRNKIYDFLYDGRSIKDEFYEKRVEIINELIIILNSQKFDNSILFIREQLSVRTNDYKYINRFSDREIDELKEDIDNALYTDFLIIISHYNTTTEEDFKENYFKLFIDDFSYYGSINIILKECPSLLKDETFNRRMMMVLEENKKINKKYKRESKPLIKRINKEKN